MVIHDCILIAGAKIIFVLIMYMCVNMYTHIYIYRWLRETHPAHTQTHSLKPVVAGKGGWIEKKKIPKGTFDLKRA